MWLIGFLVLVAIMIAIGLFLTLLVSGFSSVKPEAWPSYDTVRKVQKHDPYAGLNEYNTWERKN